MVENNSVRILRIYIIT